MILITGGNGVLGKALQGYLSALGRPFIAPRSSEVNLLDISGTTDFFENTKASVVFHLAGRVHGLMGNSRFPEDTYYENCLINANVVRASVRCKVKKIVAASTVAIYNSETTLPVKEDTIWSAPPGAHEAAYGHAKRGMLAHLEAAGSQHGLDYIYPILTNLFGPHDNFDEANGHVIPSLISKFFNAARIGGSVEVWGSGKAERDFMPADEAARALVILSDSDAFGAINVATGQPVLIKYVVESLSNISGVSKVSWDSTKPDGQLIRRYDTTKLQSSGFQPKIDLYSALESTYRWYESHHDVARR
ncbi:GDP-L-fucose synthase [Rhizobium sp. PP-F2F-G36]|nr:GDP-L-fucose synthase [Rhizobium sp. PP-F2F-G36]